MAKIRIPALKHPVVCKKPAYEDIILATLLYGCEAWAITAIGQTSKLSPQLHTADVQIHHRTHVEASH
jgi:hypothetical protein